MDKISLERLDNMHPKVKDELICAYNYINSKILGKGVRLRITHTLRTAEEQHKLFLQKPKVTNADSSTAYTNNPTYPTDGNVNLQIGRWGYNNYSRIFNGNISETLIYNRALTATEITQNFNINKGRYGL